MTLTWGTHQSLITLKCMLYVETSSSNPQKSNCFSKFSAVSCMFPKQKNVHYYTYVHTCTCMYCNVT